MGRIHLLADDIADKIAAGEVVERPASVVKELVENAIDAQATRIEIELIDGGKELIRVTDNGEGIHFEDLSLAFTRHATSKLNSAEDLFGIRTLGFRGEALPSIASVSEMVMKTKTRDGDSGYCINPSKSPKHIDPVGMPFGTIVEVKNLFLNTPVRYKFLKGSGTEKRYVTELITQIALANPHVAFRLHSDGQQILATSGKGLLLDVISQIYGYKTAKAVLSVDYRSACGQVQGYVGHPSSARGNRSGQTIILNGRVIQALTIRYALEKAYSGLLQNRSFPFAVLILDIDPASVDVNVHPAKAEVRLAKDNDIFQLIHEGVKRALTSSDLSPRVEATVRYVKPSIKYDSLQFQKSDQPATSDIRAWQPESWEMVDRMIRDDIKPEPPGEPKMASTAQVTRDILRSCRIIGQLHQTYILLETEGGLWILDQHIIHERILYEQLFNSGTKTPVQQILPEVLEFAPSDYQLIREYLSDLAQIGVELEEFGPNSYLLRGLPQMLTEIKEGWDKTIMEVVEALRSGQNWKEKTVTAMACKSSIKAGDYLESVQIRALLDRLAETENPFTCPHGRPIIIKLENAELLRRFKRI